MTRIAAALTLIAAMAAGTPANSQSPDYPPTRQVDVVEDYHGTPVADPYRWLEDTDSEETAAWVEAQNAVTFGYLESLPDGRRSGTGSRSCTTSNGTACHGRRATGTSTRTTPGSRTSRCCM